jgi:DNA-binding transcriptional LysR family regulator
MAVNLSRTVADQVFIIRFWREDAGPGQELRWRAQIRNVNTRQQLTVNDVETALALVRAKLAEAVMPETESD